MMKLAPVHYKVRTIIEAYDGVVIEDLTIDFNTKQYLYPGDIDNATQSLKKAVSDVLDKHTYNTRFITNQNIRNEYYKNFRSEQGETII